MNFDKLKNWKSDPSKGEVFTPTKLVYEMLEKIPNEVWKNPKSTFLDPCMGKGTFLIEIVRRLTYIYGYTETDAKSRVYGYDIRVKYINYLKRRGFVNVRHKDFLKEDIKMQFDVIVGNPPYQEPGATGDNKLYLRFISKSMVLTKENGFLCFVTPKKGIENILSPSKNRNYFPNKKKICYLALDTPAKYFKVGSSFCYFLIENNQNYNFETKVEFQSTNGEIQYVNLNLYNFKKLPKQLDQKTLNILNKTVFTGERTFDFKTMLRPNNKNYFRIRKKQLQKGTVKKTLQDDFSYKIMDTLKLKGNTEYYLNYPLDAHSKMKVLISKGGSVPCPFFDENGEYSASDNILYLEVNNSADGINLVNFINSKLLSFLMNTLTKGSDMDYSWSICNIKQIPLELLDDNEKIYNFYNLTEEEVKIIEENA